MIRGKSITELRSELESGSVTAEELFNDANKLVHDFQDEYNSFVTILDKCKFRDRKSVV